MYAVIFEVKIKPEQKKRYLEIATHLKKQLVEIDGFISIERFESLVEEGKLLSLSFWEDEDAIQKWKNNIDHKLAQSLGQESMFEEYRIRVAKVERDYSM